jgi:hypothetical protein
MPYVVDVNQDCISDLLQIVNNKIVTYKSDYSKQQICTPQGIQINPNATIGRVIFGDFAAKGYDQIICEVTSGTDKLLYYGTPTSYGFYSWVYLGSDVFYYKSVMVGDFNGNGADKILAYDSATGSMQFYAITGPGPSILGIDYNITPGDIPSWKSQRILVGDWNGDNRDDIILLNPYSTDRLELFCFNSVDISGQCTFWYNFQVSPTLDIFPGDRVAVAKIDNDNQDDLVVWDDNVPWGSDSRNHFFHVSYRSWYDYIYLDAIPEYYVKVGNLAGITFNCYMYWGAFKPINLWNSGVYRNDVMVFDTSNHQYLRYDARLDGTYFTYWWAFTQNW